MSNFKDYAIETTKIHQTMIYTYSYNKFLKFLFFVSAIVTVTCSEIRGVQLSEKDTLHSINGTNIDSKITFSKKEQARAWVTSNMTYDHPNKIAAGIYEKGIHYDSKNGFTPLLRKIQNKYYLAFKGSDSIFKNPSDWWHNYIQAVWGQKDSLFDQAINLTRQVMKYIQDNGGNPYTDLILTGHSLGGGEAMAASYATGAQFIVFNPEGLGKHYGNGIGQHVINAQSFVTTRDPIQEFNKSRKLKVYGEVIQINGPNEFSAHGDNNFIPYFFTSD